jgi:prophage maintenance system killer protein
VFLGVNGHRLAADDEEIIAIFLQLAAGGLSRDEFTAWVVCHVQPLPEGE